MTPVPEFVLGIDPGLGGALALFDAREHGEDTPDASYIYDMPVTKAGKLDHAGLILIIADLPPQTVAVIELVSSRPRQAGAFNFGFYTGVVHGHLAQAGFPLHTVTPGQWKRAMGLGRATPDETYDQLKDRARSVAAKLFPSMAPQFSRKKDDGRAEALLLAVYYHHKIKKEAAE